MDEGIDTGFDEEKDAGDALAFVLGGADRPAAKRDPKPPVLEVYHLWGNAVLDARRFPDASQPIRLGARSGHQWRFLGVDMGWVPGPLSRLLPAMAPIWSDVSDAWRSDFVVPETDLPDEQEWPLFIPGPAGLVANLAPGWTAFALIGGEKKTLTDLVASGRAVQGPDGGYEIAMAPDLRLVIEACGARFIAQMGPSTAALLARPEDEIEPGFAAMLAFGGFLFALVTVVARLGSGTDSTDVQEMPDRLVELLLEQPTPPPPAHAGEKDATRGERAKGPDGRVGRKDAELKQASGKQRETRKLEMDREIAESSGLLGAWEEDGFQQTVGPAGLTELADGIGGVIGQHGVQMGSDGLADRGDDFGGGGEAESLGGLSTKPGGDGRSEWGSDGGDHGTKIDGEITSEDPPIILGPVMDPSLIDEVVKRHLPQIRYCYQRELPRDPTLSGRIVVRFTIAQDGSVSSAAVKTTTMNNAAVETCIAGRFLTMQFPQPKGQGLVIVSYPFTLSAGR